MVAVTRKKDGCYIVMKGRSLEEDSPLGRQGEGFQETEWESVRAGQDVVRLRVKADFFKMKDEAEFFITTETGGSRLASPRNCILGWTILQDAGLGCFSMPQKRQGAGQDFLIFCIVPGRRHRGKRLFHSPFFLIYMGYNMTDYFYYSFHTF